MNSGDHESHDEVAASSKFDTWLLPIALGWSLLMFMTGIVAWSDSSALRPFYSLSDPRLGPAGLGSFVGHAILCGSDGRRRRVLRAGVVLELVRMVIVMRNGVMIDTALLSMGYGFLAAALADFAFHREWRFTMLAVLVPLGMAAVPIGLSGFVRRMTPETFDGALLALDAAFNVPFSEWTGQLFLKQRGIMALSLVSYAALPGAIAAGLAYEEYNSRRGVPRGVGANLLLAYAISGTVAAILYVLCPATGPAHAFTSGFPWHLPDPSSVDLTLAPYAPTSPRNAMPSLHFAWAVLLARSTVGARMSLRVAVIAFAILTAVATIGSGEHYILDLVAAAPFIVGLEAATARRSVGLRERAPAIVCGLILYAVWIAIVYNAPSILPLFDSSPVFIWLAAATTIGVSAAVALRRRTSASLLPLQTA